MFLHISQVERSGLATPVKGDRLAFETTQEHRTGRQQACNISKVAGDVDGNLATRRHEIDNAWSHHKNEVDGNVDDQT